jgi:aminoglycoside 3-N-acetyltransferase
MVTKIDIATALRALGLKPGDIVLLHSSLASLGEVEGGAEAMVEAFLTVLGDAGTLVAPVFEPGLGVISEAINNHPRAVRSVHPLACVAAIGKDAEKLCRDHWKAETAHAQGTPYLRIADKGGYVCLLGVDQDRSTTLHTAEALLRLPYLTTETRAFPTPEGEITRSWAFFPGPHRNFIGLDPLLRESGRMKMGKIGNAVVRLIRSRDLIELVLEAGRKDPAFVLCQNPNCPDCLEQRARLRRDFFQRESFTVAASAALAGEFAEAIAARCHEAGIGAVELDALRGRPLTMLKPPVIVKAISLLREEGIRVVALRSAAVSERLQELINLVREQQVPRVIAPLSQEAATYAAAAKKANLSISFFNSDLDSDACSRILLQLRDQGLAAGFTFNGANFARSGELPFLASYKKKLRRFVDQLDLVDGTYDGRPQPLACGNAEVKEMISILRCASFSGCMTLAAGNRHVGTLEDAAARFQALLQAM